MNFLRLALASAFVASLICAVEAHELMPGLYQIEVTVELPHLTDPTTRKTVSRCFTRTQLEEHDPFEILSNSPLARCPVAPICFGDGKAGFQVLCPGRAAAHAMAKFTMTDESFTGTIQMNMGGKNMTVVERQRGRRIGLCNGATR